ncbi:MAG: thiazole synthase [Candidatus Omnitrophota bacterium]
MEDILTIGGREIKNRLFIGTGKFSSYETMKRSLEESDVDIVTVALRRVDIESKTENVLNYIPKKCILVPNTSGARDADEAVRIARLAKAAGCGNWVKVEIIRDNKYLLPDNLETVKATEVLAKEGFIVLPYMCPDLSMARRLVDVGASAVMPLGAPIGSNRGIKTKELVEILISEIKIPVIVDAGLGAPSSACECMEMGCAAVLVNTAIAVAEDPAAMAKAFADAVSAGRLAHLAGMPHSTVGAKPSSPLTGFLRDV